MKTLFNQSSQKDSWYIQCYVDGIYVSSTCSRQKKAANVPKVGVPVREAKAFQRDNNTVVAIMVVTCTPHHHHHPSSSTLGRCIDCSLVHLWYACILLTRREDNYMMTWMKWWWLTQKKKYSSHAERLSRDIWAHRLRLKSPRAARAHQEYVLCAGQVNVTAHELTRNLWKA